MLDVDEATSCMLGVWRTEERDPPKLQAGGPYISDPLNRSITDISHPVITSHMRMQGRRWGTNKYR